MKMLRSGVGEFQNKVGLTTDYQSRVFRNRDDIRWRRPLHEYINGCDTYSHLPPHEALSLYHPKTKEKQEQQNQFYMDNFSRGLLVR